MSDEQWCLYKSDGGDEWTLVAAFPTLAEAQHHLRTMERHPLSLVFLAPNSDPPLDEDAALSLFCFTTWRASYAIRREVA